MPDFFTALFIWGNRLHTQNYPIIGVSFMTIRTRHGSAKLESRQREYCSTSYMGYPFVLPRKRVSEGATIWADVIDRNHKIIRSAAQSWGYTGALYELV